VPTCPVCGGQIQATREVQEYLTLKADGFEEVDTDCTDVRFYCENDCNGDLVTMWDGAFVARLYRIWSAGKIVD
jgi:hypothetical protein